MYLDASTMRSAGKKWLLMMWQTSPTFSLSQRTQHHDPLTSTSTLRSFVSSSARWRFCNSSRKRVIVSPLEACISLMITFKIIFLHTVPLPHKNPLNHMYMLYTWIIKVSLLPIPLPANAPSIANVNVAIFIFESIVFESNR